MLPELIQTFSRYSNPIGLRFEKVVSIDSTYTMLASLTNLTRLQIDATKKRFFKLDPQDFSTLTKLQCFSVGSLVVPYLQYFTNLTKLVIPRSIRLDINQLDGLQHLKKLEKFRFDVPYGLTTELNVISKFGNLASLRSINIQDDDGTVTFDSDSVTKMSRVSKVSIECRDILFPFSKLPNLESLSISSDRFDDFSTCTNLTNLSIEVRGSKKIPPKISAYDHDYQQLTALYKLKYLNLRTALKDNQFNFLSKMTDLESLSIEEKIRVGLTGQYLQDINSSKLTSIDIPALSKAEFLSHLTSLQSIRIFQTLEVHPSFELRNVTYLMAPDLLAAPIFPNLKIFSVPRSYEKVGFDLMSGLTQLSQLESLSLGIIDSETLQMIVMQTKLTELHVTFENDFFNFEDLDRLTNLKILELKMSGKNSMIPEDVIWEVISNFTNLEELKMFQIDEKSVASLMKLPKLKKLSIEAPEAVNFNKNQLSGLTNLQQLRLESGRFMDFQTPSHGEELNLPYLYS